MMSDLIPELKDHLVAEADRLAAATNRGRAPVADSSRGRPKRSTPWRPLVLSLTTALAAIAILLGWASLDRLDRVTPASGQAWAASAVRVANAVPRHLVGLPGWRITQADQFSIDEGSMTFSDGQRSAELSWSTRADPKMLIADRARSSDLGDRTVKFGNAKAQVFHHSSTKDDFEAIWTDTGPYLFKLRTNADAGSLVKDRDGGRSYAPNYSTSFTVDSFIALLASIKPVSVDAWLSAMPPSVVKPQDSEATISRILADIPQPTGFTLPATPAQRDAVHDRYQLGARVVGAVVCAWIEEWVDAKRAGNDAARLEAVRAVGSSGGWSILREMALDGAYPSVVQDYAKAMRTGESPPAGGKTTVEASFRSAFGCTTSVRPSP